MSGISGSDYYRLAWRDFIASWDSGDDTAWREQQLIVGEVRSVLAGEAPVPVHLVAVSPEVARLIEAVGADLPALLRVAYGAPIACWRAHCLVPRDGNLNPWPLVERLGEALGASDA